MSVDEEDYGPDSMMLQLALSFQVSSYTHESFKKAISNVKFKHHC